MTTATAAPTRAPLPAPTARLRDAPLLLALVVAAQFVVLQLVLRTAYLGDDAPNQVIAGYADQAGHSLPGLIWQMTVDQYHGLGRLTPIGLFQNYGLNGTLHDRVLYKLVLVVATIASTLVFARVLVAVRVPVAVALLGAGLTAPLWQLHHYHDALVSYGALTQVVLMLGCAATLAHLRWLRGGSVWWCVLSVLLLIWANLTYEAGYLMVGMVVGATFAVRARLWTALPALTTTIAFILFLLSIRTSGGQYAASYGVHPFVTTLTKQVTAALPGAGWLDPQGPRAMTAVPTTMAWVRGVLVALFLAPVLRAALRTAVPRVRDWRQLFGLFLILATPAFLPAALVSLAERYQQELRWGSGYLPLALTVPAFAAGTALLLWRLSQRVPRAALGGAAAVAIVTAVGVNASGSMREVSNSYAYGQSLDQLRSIARSGAFDAIPARTTVLFDQTQIQPSNGFWLPGYLYSPSNWLYVQAGRRWPSYPVPARQTADLCVDTFGQAMTPPCPVLRGEIAWVTTSTTTKRERWLLITPGAVTKARQVLANAPTAGTATLVFPGDRPQPIVQYAPTVGAVPITLDPAAVRRLPGSRGGWVRYAVTPPAAAASGTGTVIG